MGYTDAFDVLGALARAGTGAAETGFGVQVGAGVAAFQKAYYAGK